MERVLCAAIYVDDGVAYYKRTHSAPDTGLVFGHRTHVDCLTLVNALYKGKRRGVQGFITSTGRFVDREEAGRIAVEAGQVKASALRGGHLFSEDLCAGP